MKKSIMCFIILLTIPFTSKAQKRDFLSMSSRGVGMGDAVIATGTGIDAPALNPASMSSISSYAIDGSYFYKTNDQYYYGASITDSITNKNFHASLYYFNNYQDDIYNGYQTGMAASIKFTPNLSIGINGYWFDLATSQDTRNTGVSFDLGTILKLKNIMIGGVIFDITSEHDSTSPWEYGIGLAYIPTPVLDIEGDILMEGKNPWYRFGGEYLYQGNIAFRLGGSYRSLDKTKFLTAGLAYRQANAALQLAIKKGFFDTIKNGFWILGVSLRMYLSTGGR